MSVSVKCENGHRERYESAAAVEPRCQHCGLPVSYVGGWSEPDETKSDMQ